MCAKPQWTPLSPIKKIMSPLIKPWVPPCPKIFGTLRMHFLNYLQSGSQMVHILPNFLYTSFFFVWDTFKLFFTDYRSPTPSHREICKDNPVLENFDWNIGYINHFVPAEMEIMKTSWSWAVQLRAKLNLPILVVFVWFFLFCLVGFGVFVW